MARQSYLETCARVGTVEVESGVTLRQAMSDSSEGDGASLWWFHPVSAKDMEGADIFDNLIALYTVQSVAVRISATELVLIGAPPPLVRSLSPSFRCKVISRQSTRSRSALILRGLLSRGKYLLHFLFLTLLVKYVLRHTLHPSILNVALMGFWDWSVRGSGQGGMVDRYFKRLPIVLRDEKKLKVGWLVWIDPATSGVTKLSALFKWILPLRESPECTVLLRFLSVGDIVRDFFNFSSLNVLRKLVSRGEFRKVFIRDSLDLFPVFEREFIYGFVGSIVPIINLYRKSVARACRAVKPMAACSLLEHFPHARGFYAGVKNASTDIKSFAIQHATYNRERTYLYLDPAHEYRGEPDGCVIPHPDHFCAMSEFSKDLLKTCGYTEHEISVTGSPRFEHLSPLSTRNVNPYPRVEGALRVTVMTSLADSSDLDLIGAVWAAAHDNPRIILTLRKHPFSKITTHHEYEKFRSKYAESNVTLEEDFERSDLVMYTCSTAAEEAFLYGKRVWQWKPLGFDGSALAEQIKMPTFYTVADLSNALRELSDLGSSQYDLNTDRRDALHKMFFNADGREADRAAAYIEAVLAHKAGVSKEISGSAQSVNA